MAMRQTSTKDTPQLSRDVMFLLQNAVDINYS